MKTKIIIVSGYFNPLHKGHIDYFNNAKSLGEKLFVIVNNDSQRRLKGSQEFMDEEERLLIVNELNIVDKTFMSIDQDRSVCLTLEKLYKEYSKNYQIIFANGGDQNNNSIPEVSICKKYGISLIDGLGEKIQSEVQDEISKSQREYYLREQMKAIQKELGESDEAPNELEEIVEKLEEKMKLLELVITLAYESKINFEDVFSPVRTWDAIIYNFLKKKNIVIPPSSTADKNKEIIGAYVKDPQIGLHNWIMRFDLNSLYPHLIQQYNISPETLYDGVVCADSKDIGVTGLLEQKLDTDYLKEKQLTLTPNGQHFTLKKKGFLPQLMEDMYNERVEFKKKMLQEQQKLEDGNYTNKQTVVNNISRCNNIQMSKKILLNSAYGALANQHFRYYSLEMAEGITTAGQLAIRWIDKSINTYINKLLTTEDVDYVIASDTDSIYVTFDKLVSQVFKDTAHIDNTSKIITFLDKISKDKIEPFINSSYEILHAYVNSYAQKMQMGREVIADKGIWTAKKRYILNVYDSEGVKYKEPKLKIMGIESVRSSTPEWCRDKIQELIKTIINTDEATVMESILDYREKFTSLDFDQIAFPRSVHGIEKYSSNKSIYTKGTPIQVRGVLLYNHLLRKHKLTKKYQAIREGEKIKFAYLKEPNPLQENIISVSTHLPKEFNLEKQSREFCEFFR